MLRALKGCARDRAITEAQPASVREIPSVHQALYGPMSSWKLLAGS